MPVPSPICTWYLLEVASSFESGDVLGCLSSRFAKGLSHLRVVADHNALALPDLHVVLALGSLLWVDQFQHLLGLPNNCFILVSSRLDQRLLEWLLPGVCIFLVFSQGHFGLRLLLKALFHQSLESGIGVLHGLRGSVLDCSGRTCSQSGKHHTDRVHRVTSLHET